MSPRPHDHERVIPEHPAPYRRTDTLSSTLWREVLKIGIAGLISGVVAWAGISAKQQVMESNIQALSNRAVEDRAAFNATLVALTQELHTLNNQLQLLAVGQARLEAEHGRSARK